MTTQFKEWAQWAQIGGCMSFKAELWAQSIDGTPTGCYTLEVFLHGVGVGRVDVGLTYHKVKFTSTIETRLHGIDSLINNGLGELLSDANVALMNRWKR